MLRLDILEHVEIRLETCCSVAGMLVCSSSMWRSCWWPVAVPLPGLVALLPLVQMVLATCCSKLATCCIAVVKLATCCIMWRSHWRPVAACGGHAGELLQLMEVTLVTCCSAVSLLMTWQFVAVY